ncbi:MAG TPA: hypothetical protein VMC85_12825 [Desulfomonilaceae bacterium]|nr:hypothetical protein [Desulfomonilaceae bacterium]
MGPLHLGVKPSKPDPGDRYVPDPIAEIMPKTQLTYHENLVQKRIAGLSKTKWRRSHRSSPDWSNYLVTAGINLCRDMMRATTHCRECGWYDSEAKECRAGIIHKPGTYCSDYQALPRHSLSTPVPRPDILHDLKEKHTLVRDAVSRIVRIINEKGMQGTSKRERRVPVLLDLLLRGYDLEDDIVEIAKELNASVNETKRTNALLQIWLRDGQLQDDQALAESMEMLKDVFVDVEEPSNVTVI